MIAAVLTVLAARQLSAATLTLRHTGSADEGKLAVQHDPFKKGDCIACHDAHQGPNAGLLKAKGDALCVTCHPVAKVDAQHTKTKRQGLECLDCHSPHASADKALLRTDTHAPVAAGECATCHNVSGPAVTRELVAKVPELCVTCHDAQDKLAAKPHPHPPAADGDCLACHKAHKSGEKFLLADKQGALCETCHADVVDELKKPVVHQALGARRADWPARARSSAGTSAPPTADSTRRHIRRRAAAHGSSARRPARAAGGRAR